MKSFSAFGPHSADSGTLMDLSYHVNKLAARMYRNKARRGIPQLRTLEVAILVSWVPCGDAFLLRAKPGYVYVVFRECLPWRHTHWYD